MTDKLQAGLLTGMLAFGLLMSGCESADSEFVSESGTAAASATAAANTASTATSTTSSSSMSDSFDWGAIQWGGTAYPNATTVDMSLYSARVSGDKIYFTFDMNESWPTDDWANAVACAFMKQSDGSWYGGKFDWISKPGQSVKLTENIDDGYGAFAGHHPSAGQEMAFVWVSIDGKRRSTTAYTTWQ